MRLLLLKQRKVGFSILLLFCFSKISGERPEFIEGRPADIINSMRIAVDVSPTKTGHKVRGIGSYTQNLVGEFKKGTWGIEFEFFESPNSPPPADVVHYSYFDLFFHSLPVKSKSPRVVTIHDVIPLVFPQYFPSGIKGYINLFLQKRSLRNVDAVICDSQTSKEDIVARLSFPRQKIHVVYLAAGPNFTKIDHGETLPRVEKKFGLPKNFILYVGDVNWSKNIHNLLEAIKLLRSTLVMVGQALVDKNLHETTEINRKIKRLGIASQVIKTGFVDESDLVWLYNLAALTILPSYYEGFGLSVLESMACGTPVVCSKIAPLEEIAADVAIFCDPADPADIAEKIKYVLTLFPKETSKLSAKCQEHATKFTWHKVARQTIDVYKSVISVS